MPTTAVKSTCQGFKENGDRCTCSAVDESGFCFRHSPRISPEEKHAAAMKGGLAHQRKALPATVPDARLRNLEACLLLLEGSVSQVRRGELDIRIMNAISYEVTSAVRVWEVLLSDRIDRLEGLIHGRARRR